MSNSRFQRIVKVDDESSFPAVVVHNVQPAPLAYSEENQDFVPREEWRSFLRRLGVPFTTPKKGLNIVLAKVLEEALAAKASALPAKIRKRLKPAKAETSSLELARNAGLKVSP